MFFPKIFYAARATNSLRTPDCSVPDILTVAPDEPGPGDPAKLREHLSEQSDGVTVAALALFQLSSFLLIHHRFGH
jgi:hypothetical protein